MRRGAAAAAVAFGLGAAVANGQEAAPATAAGAAAREKARLCEKLNLEDGVAACRAALALGIAPDRRAGVRELLARHLVALERWGDLAEELREQIRLKPDDARAWERLGVVLLYGVDSRPEALAALEEAARLAPDDAGIRLNLGLALQAAGRPQEAVGAFEQARRDDPSIFDERPAAQAALEAARRGERWPPAGSAEERP
jgi:tetratricopeptide (TPR) repeat protein